MCVDASVEGKRYFDEMLLYGDLCWDDWLERTEQVRESLAGFIHADKEEVGFAPNTSTAMGIIASMLINRGVVLTMEDEFPSSTFPWINAGFKLDFISPDHGVYTMESMEKTIKPEHKILITSHVQYRTGFRQNLAEVGAFCRSRNLLFIVNATQAMGIFPIDVKNENIDFLVFSGLKWSCAGYGAAGFFIRKGLLDTLPFPLAGWRSVKAPEAMNNRELELKSSASALEAGSPSFPTVFSFGGAIGLINRIGIQHCTSRVLYLSQTLENKLRENGFPVLFSFKEKNRSGIVMLGTSHAGMLAEELSRRNVFVSARGDGLRISVNIFNNDADIETLIHELGKLRNYF